MKWTEQFTVDSHDTDMNGFARASSMIRYMQNAAYLQMENQKPSYNDLFERGKAFVLCKIGIRFYTPLHSLEKVTAQSWACESRGVSFNRCYRLLRDDAIVAEAVSVWGLLDINAKRLCRVENEGLEYTTDDMLELGLPMRMRIPADVNMVLVGEKTVEYSDVDVNRHLNNTLYADLICNHLPDMDKSRVIRMMINFHSEAPLGETLKIYLGEGDGVYYIRTLRQDGTVNIEAEMITERI